MNPSKEDIRKYAELGNVVYDERWKQQKWLEIGEMVIKVLKAVDACTDCKSYRIGLRVALRMKGMDLETMLNKIAPLEQIVRYHFNGHKA